MAPPVIDYCNSLLAGYPQTLIKPLQQVQNSASELIPGSHRAEHAKPLLKQLHWFPIEQKIKYKTSCLSYQIIIDTAAQYLADLVQLYVLFRYLHSSSDDRTFRIPIFKTGPPRITFTWWGCCGSCLWHKPAKLVHSYLFCSCVRFCLYCPFNCISFHKISPQLSAFSLCSSVLFLPYWSFQLHISL